MDISKIKPEFIKKMDAQEKFFSIMKAMEEKHGFTFIAGFLATSPEIERQYLDYKSKSEPDSKKDFFNIAFHHSLDRTITRKEHTAMIINAYEDYKKKGSWRNQEKVVKRLVDASKSGIGIKNRQRFKNMK